MVAARVPIIGQGVHIGQSAKQALQADLLFPLKVGLLGAVVLVSVIGANVVVVAGAEREAQSEA